MSLRDAIYGESASAARGCDGVGCTSAGTQLVRTRRGSLWCCPEHARILRQAGEVVAFEAPPPSLPRLEPDRARPVADIFQRWGSQRTPARASGAAGTPPELDRGPAPTEVCPTDSAGAERPDDKGPPSPPLPVEDSMPVTATCLACGSLCQSKALRLCRPCYNRAYRVLKTPLAALDLEVVLTAARSKAGEAPAAVTATPADPPVEARAAVEEGRASTDEEIARLTRELASVRGLLEEARLYIDATPPDEDGGMGSLEASLARDIDKEIATYTVFYTPPARQIGRAAQRVRDLAQTAAQGADPQVDHDAAFVFLLLASEALSRGVDTWQDLADLLKDAWSGPCPVQMKERTVWLYAQLLLVDAHSAQAHLYARRESEARRAIVVLGQDMTRFYSAVTEARGG